jgi:transforming growth factor-beta-induced protein
MIRKNTIWMTLFAASTAMLGAVACSDDDSNPDGMGGDTSTTGGAASGGSASGGATTGGGNASGGTDGGSGGEVSACSTLGIAEAAGLTSLVAAVEAAGLASTIEEGEDRTIFAPTNEAFAALLDAVGATGLGDLTADQLVPILTYHVAGSVIGSADAVAAAAGAGEFTTLGGTVMIAGDATDGLFLDPEEANAEIDLTAVDVEACNGTIVHVIDAVLLPSIADIVTTQASFSGLLGIVAAADAGTGTPKIGAALNGSADADDGDPVEAFTLFAPNNAAVAAAVAALGDDVPENQALTDVLLYHVYAGGPAVDAATALGGGADQELPTLQGSNITVDGEAGPPAKVSIEEGSAGAATVVVANIYASNGIIHVIDDVLLP